MVSLKVLVVKFICLQPSKIFHFKAIEQKKLNNSFVKYKNSNNKKENLESKNNNERKV
jgi:hypothetical protein